MPAFNRNMITQQDVANWQAARSPVEMPKTLDTNPPGGSLPAPAVLSGVEAAPGAVSTPTADDFVTRLVKYIPAEVLGAYLFVANLIDQNVPQERRGAWLLGLLVVSIVVLVLYDWLVLNIVRALQIAISALGLVVYVYSIGGVFATQSWYQAWWGTLALVVFTIVVGLVKLPPLPTVAN
jgi:hypothetical protein